MANVKLGLAKVSSLHMLPLAMAALLFGAGMHVLAQSAPSGSLSGKLTGIDSAPLAGATVVLRNRATGVEMRTTTAGNGDYRFAALQTGEYSLEADGGQLGHLHLDGIMVSAGRESRVRAGEQWSLSQQDRMRALPTPCAPCASPQPHSGGRAAGCPGRSGSQHHHLRRRVASAAGKRTALGRVRSGYACRRGSG